ncbi:uncharacterized protein LTR77_004853 [Saxophila tyrrhenica]|uniref:Uncharacterized protein n=1 Tax=Saxophila tyrrhenica TaxID=1690608 RepID=A0AAV9PDE7_9PEZI|nr:hypothetical protein LTR77_004853 [Saxophila tyrrhenica]
MYQQTSATREYEQLGSSEQTEQLPAYTDALKGGARAPQSLEEKKQHQPQPEEKQDSKKMATTKKVLKAFINGPSAGQSVARPHRYW